jgi:2-keto-4-pentenoate hydratase/2-oxohepta-3-ene-1,7-dioic acid hydratase in catechol pathway
MADHAAESGVVVPSEPVRFNKAPSCIVGPNDDIELPRGSQKTDWEVELAAEHAFPIGKRWAMDERKGLSDVRTLRMVARDS